MAALLAALNRPHGVQNFVRQGRQRVRDGGEFDEKMLLLLMEQKSLFFVENPKNICAQAERRYHHTLLFHFLLMRDDQEIKKLRIF